MSQLNLMTTRRFWPMFWTMFLGAFNDNVFKSSLMLLITYRDAQLFGLLPEQMVALCGGVFILPFFLFSTTSGQLADRYPKHTLTRFVKLLEIGIMALAGVGFLLENLPLLLATLFLMGAQSTLFSPIKYSILPQLLREDELVGGNALVSMGTFLSILLGTILGGILIAQEPGGPLYVSGVVLCLAFAGYATARSMGALPAQAPHLQVVYNPITPMLQIFRLVREVRSVYLSILAVAWFWFYGAAILAILPKYGKTLVFGNEYVSTFFLALFSVGIGVGSMLCERMSGKKLELGLVPLGAFGITVFGFDLFLVGHPYTSTTHPAELQGIWDFLTGPSGWRISFDLFCLAAFGGFYIVPLATLIQQRTADATRSRVISGGNILNALGMVLSAVLLIVLYGRDWTIPQIFLLLTGLNLLVAFYVFSVVPEFFYRFICWVLTSILYRMKPVAEGRIPEVGPAVLVCNHVSFVDWIVVAGAIRRPVRFVMHHSFLKLPFMGFLCRSGKVIPIASQKESPEILARAYDLISEELEAGNLVCIFPEGGITRDGMIGPFKPGIERIVQRNPVPVIPMALRGLWGSLFSRRHPLGRALRHPFRWLRSPLDLAVGEPQAPGEVTAETLREQVTALRGDLL